MTRKDHQIIFMALAFIKLVNGNDHKESDKSIRKLAALLDEYCFGTPEAYTLNETEAAQIDKAIDGHIAELHQNETTRLPEDRETLLKFYDRLQQRKARREQAAFYATGNEKIIADRVLKYLDDEIEYMESQT